MKKFSMIMKDPMMKMVKSSLTSLPTPLSISFLWNMGFLLGMTLILQIATGLMLSMNYVAETNLAFESVIHIMRDIDSGWVMKYLHMNGASVFFMLMFTHISRGIYFNSPMKLPKVWASGVILLLATMGAAFMGYVLPWGQMSFWGATVITSMITAIPYMGKEITQWLWGNFSVSQPTLNRFFSFHFLIPMVIATLALVHLILLHEEGSSNPSGLQTNYDKIKFFPYFMVKDLSPVLAIMMGMTVLMSVSPNLLGDVENFNTASIATTPAHIQPEWYFLFAYAILRSIPSKLGGVVAMTMSILVLMIPCFSNQTKNKKFAPKGKIYFWGFLSSACILTWIGANPVEPPYVEVGQIASAIYFVMITMV